MGRNRRLAHHLGRPAVRHLRIAVDGHLRQIGEEPRGAVLARAEAEQFRRIFQKSSGRFSCLERRMIDHIFQKWNIGFDAPDAEFPQAAVHALAGREEVVAPGGDLDEQRVVIGRDHRSAVRGCAVEPDAETRGGAVRRDAPVIGKEALRGVLGGDAALEGGAEDADLLLPGDGHLGAVQRQPLRHLDLRAHDVDAGDHFRDGVLHLDARVDLDEEPLAGIGVHQEFHSAGRVVARVAAQPHGGFAQLAADAGIEAEGGRDLDDLLVPALHGAVALP